MSQKIKEIALEERPRERFKQFGPEALSNEELLSILIRCGNKESSAKEVSSNILKEINLHDLKNINYRALKNIKGIGEVKALTILAAIEFGKRVISKKDLIVQIKSSSDVYNLVKEDLENELQEKLLAIFLDTRKYIIMQKIMFIGTVNSSNIFLRDVFREAVKCNATSFILVHNHPSGSINPSYQDVYLTNQFIKIGRILSINLTDHLIIGTNDYYSFLESKGDLFAEN